MHFSQVPGDADKPVQTPHVKDRCCRLSSSTASKVVTGMQLTEVTPGVCPELLTPTSVPTAWPQKGLGLSCVRITAASGTGKADAVCTPAP